MLTKDFLRFYAPSLFSDDQHSLMWEIWKLVGGPGASAKKAKLFASPEIRKKTARLIHLAQDKQREAAEYIEQTLKDW